MLVKTLGIRLRERLNSPGRTERFVQKFAQRTKKLKSGNSNATGSIGRRIRDCERRVANLVESIAKMGWSEALGDKLRAEEETLAKLKVERAATAQDAGPQAVLDPAAVAAYVDNLLALLESDPTRGREILARFMAPIVMTPNFDGPARGYRANGAFGVSFLVKAVSKPSGKCGCAGTMDDVCTAVKLGFERRLAA